MRHSFTPATHRLRFSEDVPVLHPRRVRTNPPLSRSHSGTARIGENIVKKVLVAGLIAIVSVAGFGQVTNGVVPFSAWDHTVNLNNLNVMISIPIRSKTGLVPFSSGVVINDHVDVSGGTISTEPVFAGQTLQGNLGIANLA